ncbi:tyrosine-type recombinase/integrase [Leptospira alexanderi]|uniref:tyrosine-type recombinase/integrase n=1 Tax=Leptospira alexanderi TaxID=100053 RepID=UPI001FD0D920|nr:site-specific integrase [Leptospira alexanderi]
MLDKAFKEMKVNKTKYSLKRSSVLTRAEVKLLCENIPLRLSLMIKALYNSGFRVSELIKIRIKDCIVTDNVLEIAIIRKRGKEVRISDAFPVKLYKQIIKSFHGHYFDKNDFLFKNNRSKKGYYSRQYLWQETNKHSKRVLNKYYNVHGFRHSHASSLLLTGAKIPAIAERLSHEDPGTTAKYYLHSELNKNLLKQLFI